MFDLQIFEDFPDIVILIFSVNSIVVWEYMLYSFNWFKFITEWLIPRKIQSYHGECSMRTLKKCVFCVVWCVLGMLIGLRCFITLFKTNILLIFFFVYLCWLLRMSIEFSKHTLISIFLLLVQSIFASCVGKISCEMPIGLWCLGELSLCNVLLNPLIFEIFLILKSTLLILKLPQLFFI